jgi:hypothetical protein
MIKCRNFNPLDVHLVSLFVKYKVLENDYIKLYNLYGDNSPNVSKKQVREAKKHYKIVKERLKGTKIKNIIKAN